MRKRKKHKPQIRQEPRVTAPESKQPDPAAPTPEREAKGFGIRGDHKGRRVHKGLDEYLDRGTLGTKGSDEARDRYQAGLHFLSLYVIAVECAVQPAMLDWAKFCVGIGSDRRALTDKEEAERIERLVRRQREYKNLQARLATEGRFGVMGRMVLMEVITERRQLKDIERINHWRDGMAGIILRATLDDVHRFSPIFRGDARHAR